MCLPKFLCYLLLLFCPFLLYVLKVGELNSLLEAQQQEVVSLQQNLTTVKQEKDSLEQELGGLVRLIT